MYCPECKQDFPGKFCPECGTKLIEVSSQNDINLNLSDNTAVLGGLNVTRNDSHNTTNFDQRIINTSNIINNNTSGRLHSRCKELCCDLSAHTKPALHAIRGYAPTPNLCIGHS